MVARILAEHKKGHRLDLIFIGLADYLREKYDGNIALTMTAWPNGWGITVKARAMDPDGPGAKRQGATRRRSHSVDWIVWGEIAAWLLVHGMRSISSGGPGRESIKYDSLRDLQERGPKVGHGVYRYRDLEAYEYELPVWPPHQAENREEAARLFAENIEEAIQAAKRVEFPAE